MATWLRYWFALCATVSTSQLTGVLGLAIPRHSVSGFSAGASAAVQHFVAYSDVVDGMGIVGGSPYGCNTLPDSGNTCSGFANNVPHAENKSIPWPRFVDQCLDYLKQRAANHSIASVSNIANKPVFLFSGTDDVWVYQNVMRAVNLQFTQLNASIKTVFDINAAHSWVVDSETCAHPGVPLAPNNCCGWKNASTTCNSPPNNPAPMSSGCCGTCTEGDMVFTGWRPPINSCNFDMAGELLRWIYRQPGAIKPRVPQHTIANTGLVQINTIDYLPKGWTPKQALLDPLAFVYVPKTCRGRQTKACGVHVHYHPCGGSIRDVSTTYMLEIGLPAYAEANRFTIVFPQSATASNPATEGCFDWYGATNEEFDTRNGVQIKFAVNVVSNMSEILRQL
eukprot:m.171878 g.171878  ORF g.171878 m.171878 type:complete len:394 (+) comp31665_c1_seq1:466-1647(+)